MYYPNGFDHARAVQLAGLVKQSYGHLESFRKKKEWALEGGYQLVGELKYRGIEAGSKTGLVGQLNAELRRYAKSRLQAEEGLPVGFVARRKSDAYLVFRGTMTTDELFHDFNIRAAPCPSLAPGKAHEGFLQIYDIFRASILETLKSLGPARKLFVTGHSLGAALATLAVADIIAATQFKSPVVYTFASPRVGDDRFASAYNRIFGGSTFRLSNTCDLVTSLPFPVPFLGFIGGFFTHVDTAVDFTIQKEDLEKNHAIDTYIEALTANPARNGPLRGLFR